jgi:SAM-dependent methyltransferase
MLKNGLIACAERYLNIETRLPSDCPDAQAGRVRFCDGMEYESISYWYLVWVLRMLAPRPWDTVYDLGSGAGRFVCLAARRPVRRCVGVEFSQAFCRIAKRNAARLRGRKAPIDIVCQDAAQADLSEGTVFYLYNPFGRDTLAAVLANIGDSLKRKPRRIKIAYTNPVLESELDSCGYLRKAGEFVTPFKLRVAFWDHPGGGGASLRCRP